ncbi:alanine dehydrogenase [Cohnella sp. CFH 77786]|uniref:alanine dehydrogenase n=1 Tax=Cohnella sp. CFH 77786 TaxID=2662265 RepID=UPI001C6092AE|nr:alanine dehydrogenase [Cohnella sp. CFH 77786]MBW5445525.1 alanine dehydrogenase [Cohnella sp. CFH 77786]
MRIGVPKEIKSFESRVGVTPMAAKEYVQAGHAVLVQEGAGAGSGFADREYRDAGAVVVESAAEAWAADMVIKVKEPLREEFAYFREDLILYTYLHLAPDPELTLALMERGVVAIAYETVQQDNGSLPLLTPMSEVAGRMSVQLGARFLENAWGGRGILLGGVPGVPPARVVIVGGGIVGSNAAKMAVGMGADVTLLDVNAERLRALDDQFAGRIRTVVSNPHTIAEAVRQADLLIGAVLIPGARAPKLVSEDMVRGMQQGSVIVDVAVDQGGSVETIDRVTTHDRPTYEKHGVIHYAVANMPGAVARTSTLALTHMTTPFGLQIANRGYREAAAMIPAIARGINVAGGKVTHPAVAAAQARPHSDVRAALRV